jgi:hypothetical protein
MQAQGRRGTCFHGSVSPVKKSAANQQYQEPRFTRLQPQSGALLETHSNMFAALASDMVHSFEARPWDAVQNRENNLNNREYQGKIREFLGRNRELTGNWPATSSLF